MKYNLESMLPIRAFSPRGKGPFSYGMTLEGGGGSWSPEAIVQGASDSLASIDPGPAIGKAGADLDKAVNDNIPGGWALPAMIAVAYMTGYFDPSMLAAEGVAAEGGAAAGADVFAGYSATGSAAGTAGTTVGAGYGAAGTGAAVFGTTEGAVEVGNLAYSNALANGATAAEANAAADAATQTYMATGYQGAAGTGNLLPSVSGEIGANIGTGTSSGFGINPALPGVGSPGVAGGISAALPEGAVLGTGLNGGEMGISYVAGPNGMVATDLLGNPIVANSINLGGFPSDMGLTGTSMLDSLNNARKAYSAFNQAKSLVGGLTGSNLAGLTMKPGSTMPTNSGLDMSSDTTDGKSPLDLTASITKGNTDFSLTPETAAPTTTAPAAAIPTPTYAPTQYGLAPGTFAAGGSTTKGNSESGNYSDPINASKYDLSANITRGNTNFHLPGYEKARIFAEGGEVEHNPEFFSEGGLGSLENRYVKGNGDGTSDDVPAMLANGEFVIPADVVSGLGNGSNDSGAKILDEFLATLRSHKQKHDAKHLPPDSKGPLAYLLEAKKRAKA